MSNKIVPYERSFASYENKEKVNCWNYEKNNGLAPQDVYKGSNKKYYFICKKCNHNFIICIANITNIKMNNWCSYCSNKLLCNNSCEICFNKSFASYENKEKVNCWNYKKNGELTPRDVYKSSGQNYWFIRNKCNHNFETCLDGMIRLNRWCGYCGNKKICNKNNCKICFNKSFASYDIEKVNCWDYKKNKNITPRDVFKSTPLKCYFICNKCNHDFSIRLCNVTNAVSPVWCAYCKNKKLCKNYNCNICHSKSFASYKNKKKVNSWDLEKNKDIIPRNIFKSSHQKYYFNCHICNHNFKITISKVTQRNQWCTACIDTNQTEKLFLNWLKENYTNYTITFQPKYNWCCSPCTKRHLPFDYCIEELNLIIEVDGMQHFKQVRNWDSHKDTFEKDLYKIKMAIENGFNIIRIFQEDIYENKNDWEEQTKYYIENYKDNKLICIGDEKLYEKYNQIDLITPYEVQFKYSCELCNLKFTFNSSLISHNKSKNHNKNLLQNYLDIFKNNFCKS